MPVKLPAYTSGSYNISKLITGDINLSLDLANKQVSGNINNTKLFPVIHTGNIGEVYLANTYTGDTWYNFTLKGDIKDVSSGSPNITFTEVSYIPQQVVSVGTTDRLDLHPMNNSENFGDAAIVKGNASSADEMVGKLAFTVQSQNVHQFMNNYISFGAKEQ